MKIRYKGFTLIEIIVVMGVLAILLPTVFSVIYIIMQQQLRTYKLIDTKKQGDMIMSYMKESIARDAVGISNSIGINQCNTAGGAYSESTDFFFVLQTNSPSDMFTFRTNASGAFIYEHYIYDNASGIFISDFSTNLNNPNTVEVSNFLLECLKRDNNSFPIVSFSYDATYLDNTPTLQEGVVTLHYQTKVKLRKTLD